MVAEPQVAPGRKPFARTGSAQTSTRRNTIASSATAARPPAVPDARVWLECSCELIDVRCVAVLGIREATPGVELVEFACPRCGMRHSSLRFA